MTQDDSDREFQRAIWRLKKEVARLKKRWVDNPPTSYNFPKPGETEGVRMRYGNRVVGINTTGEEMPNVERTFKSLAEAEDWLRRNV